MIDVRPHAEGCILPVWAQPGARKNGVVGGHAGYLKVAVTAPPERGLANKALVGTLAQALSVKRSHIELLAGASSHAKQFLIRGLPLAELRTKLASLLG
jgi:hypothetical protein